MLYDFLYVIEFALACKESTKPLEAQIVVYRTRMRTTHHLPYIADSISSRSSRCIGASKGFSAGQFARLIGCCIWSAIHHQDCECRPDCSRCDDKARVYRNQLETGAPSPRTCILRVDITT